MKLYLCLLAVLASSSAFAGQPITTPDAENVDSSCQADAQATGCTGKQVGTGLYHCLHDYKKAHKGFKLSVPCKAAMEKSHDDRKAGH
jgi:hypothetical protein